MGKLLTREDVEKARDLPVERVAVPEWGGEVLVRGLMGEERDAFEQSVTETNSKGAKLNLKNIRAKLVALCVVDEQGNRIFSDADVAMLGKKSAVALNRVFVVAQRLSGLRPEDMEEMVGN